MSHKKHKYNFGFCIHSKHLILYNTEEVEKYFTNDSIVPFSGVCPKQSIQLYSLVSVISSNSFMMKLRCQVYGTKWNISGLAFDDQSSIKSVAKQNAFINNNVSTKLTANHTIILDEVLFLKTHSTQLVIESSVEISTSILFRAHVRDSKCPKQHCINLH